MRGSCDIHDGTRAWSRVTVPVRSAVSASAAILVLAAAAVTAAPALAQSSPSFTSNIYSAAGVAPLSPNATAIAADGTIYASDEAGLRIVKVDPNTLAITEVSPAINGWSHPSGLYLESDQVHLWVADKDHSKLVQIDVTTGAFTRTIGGAGMFLNPEDLTIDSTRTGIYVNDTYHHTVVKVDYTTGRVVWTATVCAGSSILRNRGIVFGTDGNLYVTDTDSSRVLVIDPVTGTCLRAFGKRGTGPGQFSEPRGIDSDGAGGLWIAENNNFRIQHVALSGTFLSMTATTFGGGASQFRTPHGVEVLNGKVYVSDAYNYRVAVYVQNADGSSTFDSYLQFPYPAAGGFNGPLYLAYDGSANLYVVDHFNMRVEKFNPDLSVALQFGAAGTPTGNYTFPRGITVSPDGSQVIVCDSENHRFQFFSPTGAVLRNPLTPNGTSVQRPYQIALAADGTLWVADTNMHRILDIDMTGKVLHNWTNGSNFTPRGIALDAEGFVYVADTGNSTVSKFTTAGSLVATLATRGIGPTQESAAAGLAVAGPPGQETLYIADTNNSRIVEMTTSGAAILTFGTFGPGNAQLNHPQSVAVGPTGQIAIADYGNNRVSVWQS